MKVLRSGAGRRSAGDVTDSTPSHSVDFDAAIETMGRAPTSRRCSSNGCSKCCRSVYERAPLIGRNLAGRRGTSPAIFARSTTFGSGSRSSTKTWSAVSATSAAIRTAACCASTERPDPGRLDVGHYRRSPLVPEQWAGGLTSPIITRDLWGWPRTSRRLRDARAVHLPRTDLRPVPALARTTPILFASTWPRWNGSRVVARYRPTAAVHFGSVLINAVKEVCDRRGLDPRDVFRRTRHHFRQPLSPWA